MRQVVGRRAGSTTEGALPAVESCLDEGPPGLGGDDAVRTKRAGWLAFGALTASTLIGTVRFLFPNVLFEPPQTFRAGFPEEYTVGDVSTRFKDQFGVWIVRTSTEIYVLSTVCTHLGCTPNWLSGEQKFKCPCHGSGFRKTGNQLRRTGAAAAGALPRGAGRRRPDPGRQDPQVPVGEGRVERPRVVPGRVSEHRKMNTRSNAIHG